MPEGRKRPILLLLEGSGIVLGVGDDVFGGFIHQVLVVLVLSIANLWYVFRGLQKFVDLRWEVGVFGDPTGDGR